MFIDIMKLFIL